MAFVFSTVKSLIHIQAFSSSTSQMDGSFKVVDKSRQMEKVWSVCVCERESVCMIVYVCMREWVSVCMIECVYESVCESWI